MKRLIVVYSIPILMSMLLVPLWVIDIEKINVISLLIYFFIPLYLLLVNIALRSFDYGIIKLHVISLLIILFCLLLHRVGWSNLDVYKILHPDPMTGAIDRLLLQYGIIMTILSLGVTLIIKFVKSRR